MKKKQFWMRVFSGVMDPADKRVNSSRLFERRCDSPSGSPRRDETRFVSVTVAQRVGGGVRNRPLRNVIALTQMADL